MKATLRVDPDICPRCHSAMVTRNIDINLTQQECPCGYSARYRDGSQRDAQDIYETLPKVRIERNT